MAHRVFTPYDLRLTLYAFGHESSMKKAKVAILILILLIGGIVLGSLWMNLQERKGLEREEELSAPAQIDADMRLEKIRLVEDKQGKKTWELDAKAIQQFQERNIILLEDVRVTFYTKEGRSFVLSGRQGKVHQDSRNMELTGEVVLSSSDGYRLKTHSIAYEHAKKRVTTSDPVEIEGREMEVVGKGLWVDMEAEIMRILSQAKTRWKGGEGG